jgi:guanylate kinase
VINFRPTPKLQLSALIFTMGGERVQDPAFFDSEPLGGTMHPNFIVVITGPSGIYRREILEYLKQREDFDYQTVVSATTRRLSKKERRQKSAKRYQPVSREEFQAAVKLGKFVEWTEYAGHLYGTYGRDLQKAMSGDRRVLLVLDVKGAARIRRLYRPWVIWVFLHPPGGTAGEMAAVARYRLEEENRLRLRANKRPLYSPAEIDQRAAIAFRELPARLEADVVVACAFDRPREAAAEVVRKVVSLEQSLVCALR